MYIYTLHQYTICNTCTASYVDVATNVRIYTACGTYQNVRDCHYSASIFIGIQFAVQLVGQPWLDRPPTYRKCR